MVQSNSVAEAMRINFFPPALTGIVMSFLIAIVILGGVKIGKVTGYVVPIKAFFLYHCWSYHYFLSLRSNS